MRFRKFLKPYKTRDSSFREHTSCEGGFYISSSFENLLFQCAVQKFEERYFFKYFGFDFDDEGWLSFDQKKH